MKTIDELQAEISGLKAILQKKDQEIETLEKAKNEKDQEIETLEKVKNEKSEQIAKLKKLNNWYMEQLKLKAREKLGKSSEKAIDGQLSLFDVFNEAETFREPIQGESPQERIIPEHKRRKAKGGSKFNDIPVEVVEYKLDDREQICDNCHRPLTVMKKEIRKELVIVPAEVKVIEHVTYVYSCINCDKNGESGFIKIAPHPKALIKKSVVSPSFMSYIMNQKYTLALPLYRMEQEFKMLGFEISRQNLSNWIIKGANILKPIYEQIKLSLLNETLLHADETVLEVLHEPGKEAGSKSYVWVYRTSHYNTHPAVVYEYTLGRSGDYAKEFLADWNGTYLHCDGYVGYKKLVGKMLCGYLVHAKRKFHEAYEINKSNEYAKQGETYLRKLFQLETKADEVELSLREHLEMRQTKSKQVLDELYSWISQIESKILSKSLIGKVITYVINQKEYLENFLKDGRIQLSNNLAEQSVKPFVIGRSNWLFANTPNGANASTMIYSIIQSAILNNLIPQKYLTFVFDIIQSGRDASSLVPWSDEIPESCKNKKS
ncbi:IS66 family transposase [Lachnoanaerobaculum sp. JCM 36186]|uniref:IS66 family transposase n=1 Tax=Lachnoanaerobaculum sanguinis TaxID=3065809 RepID=UPI0027721273|nr:IS66 family transposase [Lachnoanaerobaculum sp. JCM 36186]GMO03712.1 IS66 family transposase [Lachnoanaerobaculum sp. JCM 36186]